MTYIREHRDMPDLSKTPNLRKLLIDYCVPEIIIVEEVKDRSFYLGEHKIKLYKKKENRDDYKIS